MCCQIEVYDDFVGFYKIYDSKLEYVRIMRFVSVAKNIKDGVAEHGVEMCRAMMNTASKVLQSKSSKVSSLWPFDRPIGLCFFTCLVLCWCLLWNRLPLQKPHQVRLTTLAKVNPSFQTAVMFHGNPGAIYTITFLGLPQRNRQGF